MQKASQPSGCEVFLWLWLTLPRDALWSAAQCALAMLVQ